MSASLHSLHYYLQARIAEQDGTPLQRSSDHYARVSELSKLFHSLLPRLATTTATSQYPYYHLVPHKRRMICVFSASPASASIKDTLETLTLATRLRQIQVSMGQSSKSPSSTTTTSVTTPSPSTTPNTYSMLSDRSKT